MNNYDAIFIGSGHNNLVAAAYRAGTGVVAFNVITLEHAEAIVAGAERAGSPVVLQISENTVKFHNGRLRPIAAATAAVAAESAIAASVHLDHVEDQELLYAIAETGCSSAMFDASKLAYDANVATTKAAGVCSGDGTGAERRRVSGPISGKQLIEDVDRRDCVTATVMKLKP